MLRHNKKGAFFFSFLFLEWFLEFLFGWVKENSFFFIGIFYGHLWFMKWFSITTYERDIEFWDGALIWYESSGIKIKKMVPNWAYRGFLDEILRIKQSYYKIHFWKVWLKLIGATNSFLVKNRFSLKLKFMTFRLIICIM